MKLVSDWKACLKWYSVQFALFGAALQGAWAAMPLTTQESLPPYVRDTVTILIFLGILVGRIVDQGGNDA